MQYVRELMPPFSAKSILDLRYFPFFKILILFSLASFYFNYKKLNLANLIFWLFFLVFALKAQRNVVYFPPLAAFVIFNNMQDVSSEQYAPVGLKNKFFSGFLVYFFAAALFVSSILGAGQFLRLVIGARGGFSNGISLDGDAQARYPKKAVEFLLRHNFPEHILNDFNSGAYLVGKTFPQRKVFIDGRTELYGADFLINYILLGRGQQKELIEETIQRFGITGFFLTISSNDLQDGLIDYLISEAAWKIVYLDESAIIFLKQISENDSLIKEFQLDLKTWIVPKPDFGELSLSGYPYANLYRARFFYRHGFYKAAADEARVLLKLRPNNPEAKTFLLDYYIASGDSANALANGITASVYFERGIALNAAGNYDAAIGNLTLASKMEPKNDLIFFALGNAWKDKRDLNKAIENFSQAVEINPQNLGALHNRAVAYCLAKEYDKSWIDVHKLRSFGADINPKVLIYLQASSERKE